MTIEEKKARIALRWTLAALIDLFPKMQKDAQDLWEVCNRTEEIHLEDFSIPVPMVQIDGHNLPLHEAYKHLDEWLAILLEDKR